MSVASLNATLEEQKRLKYDAALEAELRKWMASVLGEPGLADVSKPLQQLLKDGSVLCRLANKMHAGLVTRINASGLAFKQMENITHYLAACQMLGFQPGELFDTTDLYEDKDMMRVLQNVNVLRKFSEKYDSAAVSKLVSEAKEQAPLASGGSGSSWGSTSSKGRSKSSVLSRPTVQRNAAASAPNSPALKEETPVGSPAATTATSPAQAGPTHTRSGSAYSRTPTYSLKSNDSSSSSASLGSPSTSRAAVIEVSSLHDDVVTKEEFKYSLEVEGIAQRWIEAVLKDKFPAGVTFANALKSGVILCRLINAIKPGSVSKINTANIAYLQMENIEHYLKACAAFGLRNSDLFDTTDLFEAKKMSIVLSHIVVLGNTVKKLDTWRGPVIEDSKHAKNLWAESLNMNEINEADLDKAEENKPIPPEQQEWIDWINDQLAKRSWKPIKNLTTNLKSGVVLNRLLEVLLGQDVVYVSEPKYLWQYINNVTVALRVLAGHTFELVPGCTARDIVNGNVKNVMVLMNYLRDKFDLEFLFNKVMGEDIDDDEMDSIESDTLQWSITPTWLPEPPAPPIHAAAASSSSSSSSTSTPPTTPSATQPATPEHKASPRQPAAGFIGRPSEAATSPRRLPGALDLSPRPTAAKPQQQPPAGSPRVGTTPPASPHRTAAADAQPILSPRQAGPTTAARAPLSPRLAPGAAPAQKHHTAPVDAVHEIKPQPQAQPLQHAKPADGVAAQAAAQQRPLSPRVMALTTPVEAPAAAAVDGGIEASPKRQPRTRSHREKKEKKLERLREKSMSDRDLKKQETFKRKEEEKEKRREEKERKREEKERKKEERKKRKEEKKKQEADTVKAKKGKHRKALSLGGAGAAEIVAPAPAKATKGSSISKGTKKASIGRAKGAILAEETHAAAASQPASTQCQPATAGPSVAPAASAPAQVAQQPKPAAAAAVAPLSPRGQWGQPAQQTQPQPQATRTAAVPSIDLGTAVSATGRPVGPGSAVPATGTLRRAAQAAAELKREKARIVVRKRVVDEILSTEASYVRSLEIVVKQVLTPLRRASAKVLSDEETEVVFMNIAGLLTHHLRFLDLVKERVSSWSPRSTIGDVFLFNTDFIKEYGGYLNKYNTALVTMRHLVEKRPAFKQIKEAFELEQLKTTSLTLDAFLIMPVQRLPRYVLLLKELLKYSNQTHPDYAYLERAHAKVKAVLDELNRGIDEEAHVRVQKIISIEDDIEGLLEHLSDGLYHPQRTLVREGLLNLRITHRGARRKDSMRSFQKQYYFFAFNDLIVCCGKREPEKASKGGKGKGNADPEGGKSFRYAGSVRLSEVVRLGDGVAVDNDNAEAMQSKLMHIQFAFHVETEHVAWTLVCSSEQEKQAWLSIVRQGATNAKKV